QENGWKKCRIAQCFKTEFQLKSFLDYGKIIKIDEVFVPYNLDKDGNPKPEKPPAQTNNNNNNNNSNNSNNGKSNQKKAKGGRPLKPSSEKYEETGRSASDGIEDD